MKKVICLLIALILLLCGCSSPSPSEESQIPPENTTAPVEVLDVTGTFTKMENGNLLSATGIEYEFLVNEGFLSYVGKLEFAGSIEGEAETVEFLGEPHQMGMFAIQGDADKNILIRIREDSEWYGIYRKASLPEFDFSVERCVRLEFYLHNTFLSQHADCNAGITDRDEIAELLAEVKTQPSPREAGLYEMVAKPNGSLENCYRCGTIYGFFEEEPNLAIPLPVTSYNNLAYSVSIGHSDYVLPTVWFERLRDTACSP